MARELQVTFDAADPVALSAFWALALGYVVQPPPGHDLDPSTPPEDVIAAWAGFLERAGVPETERRSASALVDPDGHGPRIFFQRVPEGKTAKNRVHLDVRAAPGLSGDERMAVLEAECEELVELGATRVLRHEPGGMGQGHIVMRDPEGNEFCLD